MTKEAEQVSTRIVSPLAVMRQRLFRQGLEEVRAGRRPHFDNNPDDPWWAYERGRQFGLIAPSSMALWINGHLNPKAVALFEVALARRLIR
jgi:hypothetical protein